MPGILKKGSKGPKVMELQRLLTERGFPVVINGDFGDETYEAVKAFQAKNFDQAGKPLEVDGVVGQNTRWSLANPSPTMDTTPTLTGRSMYIWKLKPVLTAEMGTDTFVRKAKTAKLSSIWVKVAEGASRYANITGALGEDFAAVCKKLADEGISVWGWHVPYCRTAQDSEEEARLVSQIAAEYSLAGILMDAESESSFFKGDAGTADAYAGRLRELLTGQGKGLAISSHDIPANFPGFPFDSFARHATVNAPQVYYGGSPSVENRLERAIRANSYLGVPFVPVGAGWLGDSGGCSSASACAERAVIFMRLVREHGFPGYSFWHWQGAPSRLWEVLFTEPV